MSKLSRIRILNLNYNNNTIKIDDETFDLGGENTLISLRNGGGKSVLVQMIVSLFVNRIYRDFGDRPFKSYFTTNRPTFLITEWQLDNGTDRFLAGMMVRKNQKEDNDTEELEMYTFTGSYSEGCKYDLDHLPIIRQDGNRKMLKGFGECRNLLDEISKNEPGDFRLYDMTSQYGRRQYFATLRQYQINNKEWESIIRKVNQKESGLSELFQNAKDEKDLVENWFLRPIEDKLNQEKSRIDEFRKLTFQFVEQYRSNQSKIQRKGIIEQYFEDTKPLKQEIDEYVEKDQNASELRTEMILYAKRLHREVERLAEEITAGWKKLEQIKKEQQIIVYEQLSYRIYQCEDQKTDILAQRAQQELEITRLTSLKNNLWRKTETYDLHRLYEELKDFDAKKAEVDAKLQVLLQKTEESKEEIERIGSQLYFLYSSEVETLKEKKVEEETVLTKTVRVRDEAEKEHTENEQQIRELNKSIGALENQVESYDEVEKTFNKEFETMIQRNILGFYEEGFLDICQKEIEEEFQNQKNLSVRYARKLEEQERTIKKAAQEMADGSIRLNDIAHDLHTASEHLAVLEAQKKERCRIMKYVSVEECYLDRKDLILNHLDARIKELDLTRSSLIQKKAEQEKHFQQLKEGRTTELPENIKTYMEENGIDITYGMKWLTKNGRTAEENRLNHKFCGI